MRSYNKATLYICGFSVWILIFNTAFLFVWLIFICLIEETLFTIWQRIEPIFEFESDLHFFFNGEIQILIYGKVMQYVQSSLATHQKFGTHSGSRRSSLWFCDNTCRSSIRSFSSCTRSSRCSGRCSSWDCPAPGSRPPLGAPSTRTIRPNIRTVTEQIREARSSVGARPWPRCSTQLHKTTQSSSPIWVGLGGNVF